MKTINNLGHKLSATLGAALHTREAKMSNIRTLAMGAALSTVFVMSLSGAAQATSLGDYATKVSSNTNVVVDIISYLCYIGGAGLAALGIVDLKKHVENPGQNPVKNGLAKLGFGGILLALPFVTNVMQGTMMGDGSGANFEKFDRDTIKIGS